MKGIRGAAGVRSNSRHDILEATKAMLEEIVRLNDLEQDSVVSAIFTLTPDLNAVFPAAAAREMGWLDVPLMCAQEIAVPDAPPSIVRVLLLVDRDAPVHHVYQGEALRLRPDLAAPPASTSSTSDAPNFAEAEGANLP
jgi:chorismate mutase